MVIIKNKEYKVYVYFIYLFIYFLLKDVLFFSLSITGYYLVYIERSIRKIALGSYGDLRYPQTP